jgi:hypothetical protein
VTRGAFGEPTHDRLAPRPESPTAEGTRSGLCLGLALFTGACGPAETGRTDRRAADAGTAGAAEKLGVEQEFAGEVSGDVDGKPLAGEFEEKPEAKK